jgi:predicted flavoprotein YhiN
LSTHLKSRLGLQGIKMGLLYEQLTPEILNNAKALAPYIKALPIKLVAARPMDEAISTAGGVRWDALDANQMAQAKPGLFMAGEMLDWDAPTGGYLLTASLATGQQAAMGALAWLGAKP